MYYTYCMSNVLGTDKQIAIIGALCEGSSIRSIERTTGVHRDTIMRLGVRVGQGCTALMDAKLRNLDCHRLEMDELWGFVGKKERHLRPDDDPQFGNVWTFCAIDAERLYAWSHQTDDPKQPRRHVTVLHTEPISSPLLAVRALIVQE